MRTFTFTVPLVWAGAAYEDGAIPTGWLAADGSVTTTRPGAQGGPPPVSFTVRLWPTMADEIRIERRIDEVNGDIESTVDLDLAIANQYAALRTRFERELWPEGRPDAQSAEERAAQDQLVDVLYYSPANETNRLVLQRMTSLRDRQRVAAEWSVLIVDPPDGWEDVAIRPMRSGVAEAVARAYMKARSEAEQAAGK